MSPGLLKPHLNLSSLLLLTDAYSCFDLRALQVKLIEVLVHQAFQQAIHLFFPAVLILNSTVILPILTLPRN